MSVIWQNNEWYGQGGGGGGDVTGRAKSTAIAPVFDDTETYAEGDRVMYEDELYVFNTAHTGAWDAADADKSDVDTLTERMPATDMSEVASPMPGVMSRLPVLFDESGAEQVVGWYKLANGTKKPVYQKTIYVSAFGNRTTLEIDTGIVNFDRLIDIEASVLDSDTYYGVGYTNNTYKDYSIAGISVTNAGMMKIDNREQNMSNCNGYITLKYTKTTDTPQ